MVTRFNTTFILPDGLDLGGVTTWSVGLAEQLAQRGEKTTLIRHVDRYAIPNRSLAGGVVDMECDHRIHPNNWYLFKKNVDAYIRTYQRALPSIFIPNYSFGSYAACALLTRLDPENVRVIGMAHTDNAEYYRWLVRFESIIHKFIAVSDEIAEHLMKLLPHRQHDIIVRSCCVHVSGELSRQYSSLSQPLQLTYAGRLSERQKRVSDLVRLSTRLDRCDVDFQLRIYGSGRDKQFLADMVRSVNKRIANKIKIEGHVSPLSMAAVYQKTDILVLVSEYEGTSVSMLEGMANGCVPIVTEVSGTSAVIKQGLNGFSVPVGDMDAMAEKIALLAAHRSRLAELGLEAHKTVKERFSDDDYLSWFFRLLDDVGQQPARQWQSRYPFYFHLPLRQFIKESGYTLAAKRGFRWLYRFRAQAKKLVQ